ncbi:perosamine synthetase, partial [Clostridium botulinum C str. Stockholm]
KLLKDVKGITLPIEKEWAKNCYWLYSILVEDDFKVTRDELIKILSENGIESRPFFMPVHDMPPYVDCLHGSMDVTNEISAKGINIPSSVSLTKENIEFICSVIKSI